MARCPRGAYYDEGGICGCGAGHEDQEMVAGELAKARERFARPLPPDPSPATCTYCGKPFNMIDDHSRCAVTSSGAKPN